MLFIIKNALNRIVSTVACRRRERVLRQVGKIPNFLYRDRERAPEAAPEGDLHPPNRPLHVLLRDGELIIFSGRPPIRIATRERD